MSAETTIPTSTEILYTSNGKVCTAIILRRRGHLTVLAGVLAQYEAPEFHEGPGTSRRVNEITR